MQSNMNKRMQAVNNNITKFIAKGYGEEGREEAIRRKSYKMKIISSFDFPTPLQILNACRIR
jgi:hypothetical protein